MSPAPPAVSRGMSRSIIVVTASRYMSWSLLDGESGPEYEVADEETFVTVLGAAESLEQAAEMAAEYVRSYPAPADEVDPLAHVTASKVLVGRAAEPEWTMDLPLVEDSASMLRSAAEDTLQTVRRLWDGLKASPAEMAKDALDCGAGPGDVESMGAEQLARLAAHVWQRLRRDAGARRP